MSSHRTLLCDWLVPCSPWAFLEVLSNKNYSVKAQQLEAKSSPTTCTMKKLPSAVLIVVLIHHVCVATEKKPAKGERNNSLFTTATEHPMLCVYVMFLTTCPVFSDRSRAIS